LRHRRGTTLYLGNALTARLLKSAIDLGVELRSSTSVRSLVLEDGRVSGVNVSCSGTTSTLHARRAVILATGGVSNDAVLRARYVPALAASLSATVKTGAARSGASLAQAIGGQLSAPTDDGAFWVPGSTFQRRDGSLGVFPHTVTDRSKPGLIAVDAKGRRFTNEALSYHEFVRAQLKAGADAIPAILICDQRFLWKYGLGRIKPFSVSLGADIASGYLKRAATISELAQALDLPSEQLSDTIDSYNLGAREGLDPEFGRGGDAYQRHLGDAENCPNPCVAPIEKGPFYAVAVLPSDLGMAAGIITDAQARVLSVEGSIIPGLYACGNDMESVMHGAYPGPGITLGPALTFGYVAARHAASQ
jgi:succinate dehydrogenase/fumarate reductase flavoprotein subunit